MKTLALQAVIAKYDLGFAFWAGKMSTHFLTGLTPECRTPAWLDSLSAGETVGLVRAKRKDPLW
jgi:hypothetical protein